MQIKINQPSMQDIFRVSEAEDGSLQIVANMDVRVFGLERCVSKLLPITVKLEDEILIVQPLQMGVLVEHQVVNKGTDEVSEVYITVRSTSGPKDFLKDLPIARLYPVEIGEVESIGKEKKDDKTSGKK